MSQTKFTEKLQRVYHKHEYLWYLLIKLKWFKSEIAFRLVDDESFQHYLYKKMFATDLNLENPSTLDEKQIFLKLHNRDNLLTKCTDKVDVRNYVKDCGLESILVPQYGIFNSADEIPFHEFEKEVFIKCNHLSGANKIFDPSSPFDVRGFKRKFNYLLKKNQYHISREWNYKNISSKIICEKVLRDNEGRLPLDYKFYCFSGEPVFLGLSIGTCDIKGEHGLDSSRYFNTYDMDFNQLDVDQGYPILWDSEISAPSNFEEMKSVCRLLSRPFPFVRVDLYNIENHIYFGELTFYDNGGFGNIKPDKWNREMAKLIDLSAYV